MDKEIRQNKLTWLKKNGFNEEGITYIYFPKDSYDVKEELKSQGFRFSRELYWHIPYIPEGYEDKVFDLKLVEVAENYVFGAAYYPNASAIVLNRMKQYQPPEEEIISNSEWIGEKGGKIAEIPVTLVSKREMNTRYGTTNLYTFLAGEDKIQWWSTSIVTYEEGANLLLSATIKNHSGYKNEKITTVKYCKLKEV